MSWLIGFWILFCVVWWMFVAVTAILIVGDVFNLWNVVSFV